MLLSRAFVSSVLAIASWCAFDVLATDAVGSDAGVAETCRRHGLDPAAPAELRVAKTPESVIAVLREAGVKRAKNHLLSPEERAQLKFAIESLTPLHRRILKERLRSLNFVDGMTGGGTALTSTVNPHEPVRLCDIAINAAIFRQNVSEWLSAKERRCFETAGSPLRINIEAGTRLGALVYVLLHEATHVVDSALGITPHFGGVGQSLTTTGRPATAFTDGVWNGLTLPVARYRDPLREQLWFYSGTRPIPVDQAPAMYDSLRRTPFVSLYAGRNWLDDLAEFVTVYHLTEVLKQPYRIVVRRGNQEIFAYEPRKSELVRGRIGQLKQFYN